jgi:polyhydroxyalkanoate synthesis regulator protein
MYGRKLGVYISVSFLPTFLEKSVKSFSLNKKNIQSQINKGRCNMQSRHCMYVLAFSFT